jgi:homoserine O-acetyltransferase/O-succinyltransferase
MLRVFKQFGNKRWILVNYAPTISICDSPYNYKILRQKSTMLTQSSPITNDPEASPIHVETIKPGVDLMLENGFKIPAKSLQIKYLSIGLNENPMKPIIYVFPSLSNSPFLIDSPEHNERGWWRKIVGYGESYGIDLNKFAVICASPLGSPFGSTSPVTINSDTGKKWEGDFPTITPLDMAKLHNILLEYLGVEKVSALVGGSMGGMQVLQFASLYPGKFHRACAIAATGHTSPSTVGLRFVQRQAVKMDKTKGLRVARMIGTIGYRSREEFDKRFSWDPIDIANSNCNNIKNMDEEEITYEVESYLKHQADLFERGGYNVDCYLTLSSACDRMSLDYDVMKTNHVNNVNDIDKITGLKEKKEMLLLPYSTDAIMPPCELMEVASNLGPEKDFRVHYEVLHTIHGHDAFMVPRHKEVTALCKRLRPFFIDGVDAVRRFHHDAFG